MREFSFEFSIKFALNLHKFLFEFILKFTRIRPKFVILRLLKKAEVSTTHKVRFWAWVQFSKSNFALNLDSSPFLQKGSKCRTLTNFSLYEIC